MRKTMKLFWVFLGIAALAVSIHGVSYAASASEMELKQEKVEYTAGELDDPFKEEPAPVVAAVPVEAPVEKRPLPEMKITGIVWGGIFPQAIINGKVVKKGDVIDEVRIMDITKEGLVVFFQGAEYKVSSPGVDTIKKLQKKSTQTIKGGKNEK